jgi:hypothetical protein
MSHLYLLFRRLEARWLWLMFALIGSTIAFGYIGFGRDGQHTPSTKLYLISLLFALNCSDVAKDVSNWQLEVARWLGVATWLTTVAAILVKLFSDHVLAWFVRIAARDHIVVAGLGRQGHDLVGKLRDRRENVIVVTPDTTAEELDSLRDLGAIVLNGDARSASLLDRACLSRARRLLVLFEENDQSTLQILTEAYRLLKPNETKPGHREIRGIARFTEPGLQEVINHRDLHRDCDTLSIQSVNLHELCARSMLSRARWHSRANPLRRIVILGLGDAGRLSEALILCVVKDVLIDDAEPLDIHLYERGSHQFVRELRVRHPHVDRGCRLHPHDCSSDRCGIGCDDAEMGISNPDFDAAFICIDDEARSAVLAARLGKWQTSIPIVVRTNDSRMGLGAFLSLSGDDGGRPNIVTVGFEDLILDPALALDPRRELLAQACHEGYLAAVRHQIVAAEQSGCVAESRELRSRPANVPWERLSEANRESNRALVDSYIHHLQSTDPTRKPNRYVIVEAPAAHEPHPVFQFSPEEIEFLAEQEHARWMQFRLQSGWTYAPVRNDASKQHNGLVPYSQLDESTREFDRDIFRRLPTVLARAEFMIRVE